MSYPFDLETFISENKELVKEYINKDTMNVEIPDIEIDSSDFYRNNEQLSTHKIDKYQFTLMQKLEYVKCFKDVVYFTEKYGKVISVDDGIIPFKLWDFQKDLLRLYQNHRFVVAAQCRQSGKTQTTTAFALHFMIFNPAKTIGVLANKTDQAQEIIERIQLTYEMLPFFLKGSVKTYNKRSMKLSNESRIFAGGSGNGGIRGKSLSLVIIDEVAFLRDDMDFYESTYPVISSGKDSRVIMMSTPNGARGLFYKIFTESKEGKNEYKHIEVKWHQVPGRDEKWKEETIRNTSQEAFDQEQDLKFRGSQNSLISSSVLERLYKADPIEIINEKMKIFEHAIPGQKYVVVSDSARGLGRDYSASVVFKIEKKKYTVVATFRDNRISPMVYPMIINNLSKLYNDAPILIELNDIGEQVAGILYYDYENADILPTYSDKGKQVVGYDSTMKYGVKTSRQVKAVGCATVKTLIEKNILELVSDDIIDEFGTFVPKGSSYEADEGAQDDLADCCVLFSWLTTQQYFIDEMQSDSGDTVRAMDTALDDYNILPFGIIDDGVNVSYSPDDDFFNGF